MYNAYVYESIAAQRIEQSQTAAANSARLSATPRRRHRSRGHWHLFRQPSVVAGRSR